MNTRFINLYTFLTDSFHHRQLQSNKYFKLHTDFVDTLYIAVVLFITYTVEALFMASIDKALLMASIAKSMLMESIT